ncbi:cytochrome b5-like heme/steroid binding domain-containing protein [Blastocladiella britannica]|nr:cytochrome b5-like heme/steroid binding domain-containing protein [Blastocladiella britannica]
MVHAERLHYDPKNKRPRGKQQLWSTRIVTAGKVAVLVLIASLALSYVMFGNLTFNYKVPTLGHLKNKYLTTQRVFTPEELALYNGTDPTLPIYLAVMSDVFDVTAGRDYYGPGSGYHFFAGRDAGRAFATGCFQTHLTPDLRGLTDAEIKSIDGWRDFYAESDKYFAVGKLIHHPIDPNSPIPLPRQ